MKLDFCNSYPNHIWRGFKCIQIRFLQMAVSPDALATRVRFCVTSNMTHEHHCQVRSDGNASEWLSRIHAAAERYGGQAVM